MKGKKVLWGGFFIAAAVLIVINQMGYFTGIGLWSLLLTILVVPIIGHGIRHRNFFNIFFGVAFLLIIYERPLGIGELVPWTVLVAALLLSIGFTILFKPKYKGWEHRIDMHRGKGCGEYSDQEIIDSEDEVNCSVSLGDSSKYVHSTALQRGRIDCSLGHLSVYFDHAALHPNGAEIRVDCSLGGMELYIPRDWNVQINVDAALSGVTETPRREPGTGPILLITGSVSLGSLEIKYI